MLEIERRGIPPYNIKTPPPEPDGREEDRQLFRPQPALTFAEALVIMCKSSCFGDSPGWEIIDSKNEAVLDSSDSIDKQLLEKIDAVGLDGFVILEP